MRARFEPDLCARIEDEARPLAAPLHLDGVGLGRCDLSGAQRLHRVARPLEAHIATRAILWCKECNPFGQGDIGHGLMGWFTGLRRTSPIWWRPRTERCAGVCRGQAAGVLRGNNGATRTPKGGLHFLGTSIYRRVPQTPEGARRRGKWWRATPHKRVVRRVPHGAARRRAAAPCGTGPVFPRLGSTHGPDAAKGASDDFLWSAATAEERRAATGAVTLAAFNTAAKAREMRLSQLVDEVEVFQKLNGYIPSGGWHAASPDPQTARLANFVSNLRRAEDTRKVHLSVDLHTRMCDLGVFESHGGGKREAEWRRMAARVVKFCEENVSSRGLEPWSSEQCGCTAQRGIDTFTLHIPLSGGEYCCRAGTTAAHSTSPWRLTPLTLTQHYLPAQGAPHQ